MYRGDPVADLLTMRLFYVLCGRSLRAVPL